MSKTQQKSKSEIGIEVDTGIILTDPVIQGWPIKMASVHQPVPMAGQTEKTISHAKYHGIKMTWAPQGLVCEVKGRRYVIPSANVAVAELE